MSIHQLSWLACPSFPLPSTSVDLDGLPDSDKLVHIQQLGSHSDDLMSVNSSESEATGKPVKQQTPVLISNSLPLVPAELVQQVEEGLFIEMEELQPNVLDLTELNTGNGYPHIFTGSQTLWNGCSAWDLCGNCAPFKASTCLQFNQL